MAGEKEGEVRRAGARLAYHESHRASVDAHAAVERFVASAGAGAAIEARARAAHLLARSHAYSLACTVYDQVLHSAPNASSVLLGKAQCIFAGVEGRVKRYAQNVSASPLATQLLTAVDCIAQSLRCAQQARVVLQCTQLLARVAHSLHTLCLHADASNAMLLAANALGPAASGVVLDALAEPTHLPWRALVVLKCCRSLQAAYREDKSEELARAHLDDVSQQLALEHADPVPLPAKTECYYSKALQLLKLAKIRADVRASKPENAQGVIEQTFAHDGAAMHLRAACEASAVADARALVPAADADVHGGATDALRALTQQHAHSLASFPDEARESIQESSSNANNVNHTDKRTLSEESECVHSALRTLMSVNRGHVAQQIASELPEQDCATQAVLSAHTLISKNKDAYVGCLHYALHAAEALFNCYNSETQTALHTEDAADIADTIWSTIDHFLYCKRRDGIPPNERECQSIQFCLNTLVDTLCLPTDWVAQVRVFIELTSSLESRGHSHNAYTYARSGLERYASIPRALPERQRAHAMGAVSDLVSLYARLAMSAMNIGEHEALKQCIALANHGPIAWSSVETEKAQRLHSPNLWLAKGAINALVKAEAVRFRDWDRVDQCLAEALDEVQRSQRSGHAITRNVCGKIAKQAARMNAATHLQKEAAYQAVGNLILDKEDDIKLSAPAVQTTSMPLLRISAQSLLVIANADAERQAGKTGSGTGRQQRKSPLHRIVSTAATAAVLAFAANDTALATEAATHAFNHATHMLMQSANRPDELAPGLALACVAGMMDQASLPVWASTPAAKTGYHCAWLLLNGRQADCARHIATTVAEGARLLGSREHEQLEVYLAQHGWDWNAPEGEFHQLLKAVSGLSNSTSISTRDAWESIKSSTPLRQSDRVLEATVLLLDREEDLQGKATIMINEALEVCAESGQKIGNSGGPTNIEAKNGEKAVDWAKRVLSAAIPGLMQRRKRALIARKRRKERSVWQSRLFATTAMRKAREQSANEEAAVNYARAAVEVAGRQGHAREARNAASTALSLLQSYQHSLQRKDSHEQKKSGASFSDGNQLNAPNGEPKPEPEESALQEEKNYEEPQTHLPASMARDFLVIAMNLLTVEQAPTRSILHHSALLRNTSTLPETCRVATSALHRNGFMHRACDVGRLMLDTYERIPALAPALEHAAKAAHAVSDSQLLESLNRAAARARSKTMLCVRHLEKALQAHDAQVSLNEAKEAARLATKRGDRRLIADATAAEAHALASLGNCKRAEEKHKSVSAAATAVESPREHDATSLAASIGERRLLIAASSSGWLAMYGGIRGGPDERRGFAEDAAKLAEAWFNLHAPALPTERWRQGETVPKPHGVLVRDAKLARQIAPWLAAATFRLFQASEDEQLLPIASLAQMSAAVAGESETMHGRQAKSLRIRALARRGQTAAALEALLGFADVSVLHTVAHKEPAQSKYPMAVAQLLMSCGYPQLAESEVLVQLAHETEGKTADNATSAHVALLLGQCQLQQWRPADLTSHLRSESEAETAALLEECECRSMLMQGWAEDAAARAASASQSAKAIGAIARAYLKAAEADALASCSRLQDASKAYKAAAEESKEQTSDRSMVKYANALQLLRKEHSASNAFARVKMPLHQAYALVCAGDMRNAASVFEQAGHASEQLESSEEMRMRSVVCRSMSEYERAIEHARKSVRIAVERSGHNLEQVRLALLEVAVATALSNDDASGGAAAACSCWVSLLIRSFDEAPHKAIAESHRSPKSSRAQQDQQLQQQEKGGKKGDQPASARRKQQQSQQQQQQQQQQAQTSYAEEGATVPGWATALLSRAGLEVDACRLCLLLQTVMHDPLEELTHRRRTQLLHSYLYHNNDGYRSNVCLPVEENTQFYGDALVPKQWLAVIAWQQAPECDPKAGSDDSGRQEWYRLIIAFKDTQSDTFGKVHKRLLVSASAAETAFDAVFSARKASQQQEETEGTIKAALQPAVEVLRGDDPTKQQESRADQMQIGAQGDSAAAPATSALRELESAFDSARGGGPIIADDAATWLSAAIIPSGA